MRLIHRHRHPRGAKAPRLEITQAEITADLRYPAPAADGRRAADPAPRASGR